MGSMLAMGSGDFSTAPRACHDPSAHGARADERPPDFHDAADENPAIDEAERLGLLLPQEFLAGDGDLVPGLVPVDAVERRFGEAELLLEQAIEPRVSLVDLLRLADDLPAVFEQEGPLHPCPRVVTVGDVVAEADVLV